MVRTPRLEQKRARLATITDVDFTLKTIFKKEKFRGLQKEIVSAALHNHDIFVLLPTGHGKSLTFQLPAVAKSHGCTLVISPLVALMDAQVSALRDLGVAAGTLNSLVPLNERRVLLDDLVCGHPKTRLLYVSPELCATESFRKVVAKLVKNCELNRIVVDEAHCIVDWNGFRAPYKELGYFKRTYPHIPMTVLTATASPSAVDRIKGILGLSSTRLKSFTTSINRPNLHFEVRFTEQNDVQHDIVNFLLDFNNRRQLNGSGSSGAGIIYCRKRDTAERIADGLRRAGINAHPFHSEINKNEKARTLKGWISNTAGYQVIVATIAFGMGIDKPDCRFVIHYDMPNDIQSYYQACGRAGRDNRAARCILYYSRQDTRNLARLRNDTNPNDPGYLGFQKIVNFCESVTRCRHLYLAECFGEKVPDIPSKEWCDRACDYCKDKRGLRSRASVLAFDE